MAKRAGASPPPGSWLDNSHFVHSGRSRATMGEQSSSFKALLINLKAPVGLVFSTLQAEQQEASLSLFQSSHRNKLSEVEGT